MHAEIYWTPRSDDDIEVMPGKVTKIERIGNSVRVYFSGRHASSGDTYSGVLLLGLHARKQEFRGKQSVREIDGDWEIREFTLTGKFTDGNCSEFSGTWIEQGHELEFDLVALALDRLPPSPSSRQSKPKQPGKARARRKSR